MPDANEQSLFNVASDNSSILALVSAVKGACPEVDVRYSEQDIRTHYSFGMHTDRFRRNSWQPQVTLESGLKEIIQKSPSPKPRSLIQTYCNFVTDSLHCASLTIFIDLTYSSVIAHRAID